MKAALVTAIGSFSADIVIKNLKKQDFTVIGCDIYPKEWLANSLLVDDFYRAPYAINQHEYMNFIKSICQQESINYVIPLTDVEIDVLNSNRTWFEEQQICLCMSSCHTIDLCRNKDRMAEFTGKLDCITTIPTQSLKGKHGLSSTPCYDFPVICKPINGRSSQGIYRIHTIQEWKSFCLVNDLDNYIVQPLISGSVVTVDVIRQANGKKTATIPRLELLRTLNGAGTSVYVFEDRKLQDSCIALANSLQIVGCVNFEFIKAADGVYHFIECNPRFSGGVAFSCLAGYDCINNHILAFSGKEIDDLRPFHNQYIVKKYEEHITFIE